MESNLVWLHLSDIHFYPKTSWRDVASRQALLTFLQEQFSQGLLPKPDLVFCTGDIAFGEATKAPMTQQYAHAKEFFDTLLKYCGGLARDRLFVVPGNHDINRAEVDKDAQETLVKKADAAREHEAEINQRFEDAGPEHKNALRRLNNYGEFVSGYLKHQVSSDRHVYARLLEIKGKKIGIAGLNSAWSCAGPEDDRHLWLAAKWQFNHVKPALEESHIRIGLLHHPVDWLNEAERDLSTRRINSDFQFWLHGHSHNAWVDPGQTSIKIAAGAVGAKSPEEFGVNLVHLDFSKGKGEAHLFRYSPTDDGWVSQTIPHHAPRGVWPFTLPPLRNPIQHHGPKSDAEPVSTLTEPVVTPTAPPAEPRSGATALAPSRKQRLFGRESLLAKIGRTLEQKKILFLFGMRGNGKTELIRQLADLPPLAGKQPCRIPAGVDYGPDYLFRQLAPLLRDSSEQPFVPTGSIEDMASQLKQRYPHTQPASIWVDMAHLWFGPSGWCKPELGNVVAAMQKAFSDRWHWIFELRERPSPVLLGNNCFAEEVPGLDKQSLADCLRAAAPGGLETQWSFSGEKLKLLYQWLGGGHGEQAHPLATQLLIEVAHGRGVSPLDVRQRYIQSVEKKVEDFLLRDLYESVLTDGERNLLDALALYRDAIPHDHIDRLEEKLSTPNAWTGLDRRCLLPCDSNQIHYYLHGFIAGWVRQRLGYQAENGEQGVPDLTLDISPGQHARLAELHALVADCWLSQLGRSSRISLPNIQRALEAFHHLLCAGDADRIQEIATELLLDNKENARQRLWEYDEKLRANDASIQKQRLVLDYITQLDPNDHKAWRFLGECWQKEEGRASSKALVAFERALHLHPDFPPYLGNLGKTLQAQGPAGAKNFLHRLTLHREEHPKAIDNYILAIEAECLMFMGSAPAASQLRQDRIAAGDRHPAFYNAEAEYQLGLGHQDEALRLLDLALQRGCSDEYTESIRAKVLEAQGNGAAASQLRQDRIAAGDRHPAFYNAEAEYQLGLGHQDEALRLLDLALQRGCSNEYTESIRAKIYRMQHRKLG